VSDPPGSVTSVSVTIQSPVDVLVTWEPPDNLTVALLGYFITYRVIGIGDCNDTYSTPQIALPQLPAGSSSYSLTGPTPWLKYRISVQAVNVGGRGQRSSVDFIVPGSGNTSFCFLRVSIPFTIIPLSPLAHVIGIGVLTL